jgi:uncharacterized cupin superfamily protein
MASATTDRRLGLTGDKGMKAPVRAATLANITLSGEQTIDAVAVVSGDDVLVKNQTVTADNGIWTANTGAWTRRIDSNGNLDLVKGTTVLVTDGGQGSTFWSITSANPITVGSSAITWGVSLTAAISTLSFTQSGTGAVARSSLLKMREVISSDDFGGTRGTYYWGIGTGAFASTTTATDCIAIGDNTLNAMTSGFGNVAIGKNALKSLTINAYTTAVGAYAGESANLAGNVNLLGTYIGAYAGYRNTDGQYGTFVGAYAGENNTTGYFGTFVGQGAGRANTTGFSSTLVGHSAGLAITGASSYHTIVGENGAPLTTVATAITTLGYGCLSNNVTGNSYSVAIGYAPLGQSTSSDPSVAIGRQAGYTLVGNGKAVLVGHLAYTLGAGARTTAIGHEAGGTETGTGTDNVWLGYRAGYTQAINLANVVCLGSNSAATRSNQVQLGDGNITEVKTTGYIVQKLVATGSTTLDNNGEFVFYVVDNTHVNFKYKGSDGTVRAATGAFAAGGFTLA